MEEETTILDEWEQVATPPPVEIKQVSIKSSETALLILDMQASTCNQERRPRCVASVPRVQRFLERARQKGMTVIYSLTRKGTPSDILPELTPKEGDPIVRSSVDKFFETALEKILKDKGIESVILAGTSAEGAVLHTATAAAMRGYQVVVPVDGISAGNPFAELYTVWHLVNAPGSRNQATLTRFDMIKV
ncbi:MAG: cysteine hydrolase [Deltaproteobacteria bacterium]|nr:cysteine hydrolase [Deltaproteobacteria bacterium]